MRVAAIIQARMGSTRLPGKVLRDMGGEPMLARVVERVSRTPRVEEVIVATTTRNEDDAIADLCQGRGWRCFRGSELDVLDRYHQAAVAACADAVIRITSDCPLIDPEVVGGTLEAFLAGQPDLEFASNVFPPRTFPRGLDAEVIRRDLLDRLAATVSDRSGREHVTWTIYHGMDSVPSARHVAPGGDWNQHRWTVDTPEDLTLARAIYRYFGHDRFTWRQVLEACAENPEWEELNRGIEQKLR